MKHQYWLFTFLISFIFINTSAQKVNLNLSNPVENPDKKGLLIPNAFSPNGDGRNDLFEILNFDNQTLIEFKVFNRWGTVVFKTENPKKGWDGTYKNILQPVGTYGYVIRILYPEGIEETYKGTVTLIR